MTNKHTKPFTDDEYTAIQRAAYRKEQRKREISDTIVIILMAIVAILAAVLLVGLRFGIWKLTGA